MRWLAARLVLLWAVCVLLWVVPADAILVVSSGPFSLAGESVVAAPPGGSVLIYRVGLTGAVAVTRLTQIELRIGPLAAPLNAGLAQADFTGLRLIESANGVFGDGDDVLLNTILPGAIDVTGGITAVTDAGAATVIVPLATLNYFVVADIAAGATDGNTFRLAADADHIQTTLLGTVPPAAAIIANNANRVVTNQLIPILSLAPASLAFGTHDVDSSATLQLTVSNVGAATLNVTSVVSDDGQFVRDLGAFAVAPSANQVVNVTFTPSSPGFKSGNLGVTYNPTTFVGMTGFGAGGSGASGSRVPTGRPIPVGWEWFAGLLFLGYGLFRIFRAGSG